MNFNEAAAKPHTGIINAAGKLPIGTGNTFPTPEILGGSLISPGGTISIGYSSPNITLDLVPSGAAIESVNVQAGTTPIVPSSGAITIFGGTVSAGITPVRTFGNNANKFTTQVQISQAIAATDATKIGLAVFDSAAFDVDANGFVQLNGGGIAATSFTVDANTAPGTNPVVPTAAGAVTIEAAAVAAHSVPIETRSRAANTFKVEVQEAAAVAATDATKSGIAHFDSARFTVDANGFVSVNGSGLGETITGDSGGALSPSSGNWNILGRSGSKTSGSGSTLTVNSPPFSQIGSSATSVLNSGEFVTAAVTRTLPATAGLIDGDLVIYSCTTAGALVITANTGQTIRIGTLVSSSAGTATSTNIGDSVSLRFDATAISWRAVSVIGTWLMA